MRSRFRLNSALVVGAMVNGTIAKTVDEKTGEMMRPTNMQPVYAQKKTGCGMTWCREKAVCQCACKTCKRDCSYRDLQAFEDDQGVVHLMHANGKERAFMSRAEYEKLVPIYLKAGMRDPSVKPMDSIQQARVTGEGLLVDTTRVKPV